jgi:hypothetical protein
VGSVAIAAARARGAARCRSGSAPAKAGSELVVGPRPPPDAATLDHLELERRWVSVTVAAYRREWRRAASGPSHRV